MVRVHRDHHEDQLGSKCSICCCLTQTGLEDEGEEDKEEDENDASGCQQSLSSPPQRARKGQQFSPSILRTDGQRASSPESLGGWSSCTETQSWDYKTKTPRFFSKIPKNNMEKMMQCLVTNKYHFPLISLQELVPFLFSFSFRLHWGFADSSAKT